MRLLVLHGKQGDEFLEAADDLQLHAAALDVVRERLEQDWYYDNWDDGDKRHQWNDRAKRITEEANGRWAWGFLRERDDHEYEGVELREAR